MPPGDRSKALALMPARPGPRPPAAKAPPGGQILSSRPKAAAIAPPPRRIAHKQASTPVTNAGAGPVAGNWRIQLGAFSERAAAEALYHRMAGKAGLLGRAPSYVAVGKIIRLQVGPYASRSAAEAACRTIGSACFPVGPK
jgi:uncharacterized protein